MRMIPNEMPPCPAEFNLLQRNGYQEEAVVFELLQQLEWPGVAVHRKLLRQCHETKVTGEADFLLIIPEGVFVLEVKGAFNLECREGVWFDGERELRESPMDQAAGAGQAVHTYLRDRNVLNRGPNWGWGVVLTKACLPPEQECIDLPVEAIMDASVVRQGVEGMKSYLQKMTDFHRARFEEALLTSESGDPGKLGKIEDEDLRKLELALAPDWDFRPTLAVKTDIASGHLHGLTTLQYQMLHFRGDHKRSLIEGGAGTGKTFLAKQWAKQKAEEGLSVYLVVRNPGLARYLKTQLTSEGSAARVFDYDGLKRGIEDGSVAKADHLVVDEGQDLLHPEVFDVLEKSLEGGFKEGSWWWFQDLNNQAGFHGPTDPTTLEMLLSYTEISRPYQLEKNCRNTQEIVTYNKDLLRADLGQAHPAASGPVPDIHELDSADGAEFVEKALELFNSLDPGKPGSLQKNQVTVIVVDDPGIVENCIQGAAKRNIRANLRRFLIADIGNFPPDSHSLYMTPEEIKGLENDHVIVIVDPAASAWDDEKLLSRMYVALTRARVGLHLVIPAGVMSRLRELREV